MTNEQFKPFGKIARLSREMVISEKIDGTNAQLTITEDGQLLAGSRNRWLTPASDNAGFAGWAEDNKSELLKLGVGTHFGEWWGAGIQRKYGLAEKRFSLFNTSRWCDNSERPECCGVVPVLYKGIFESGIIEEMVDHLRINGSVAAPEFMDPEGVVIFHVAANMFFKKTCKKDYAHKNERNDKR